MEWFRKDADLVPVNVLQQIWKAKSFSYRNTARPNYGILYLTGGQAIYTFDRGRIELAAGEVIYLPKGANYEVAFVTEGEAVRDFLVNFDLPEGEVFSGFDRPVRLCRDLTGSLRKIFEELSAAWFAAEEPLYVKALFYTCMHRVLSASGTDGKDKRPQVYTEAARLLAENPELSVDEIAGKLFISHSGFQKQFAQYYGCSPMEYRMRKRMERAKALLQGTDLSIQEISDMLGFYDNAAFYKAFTGREGMTPNRYRKSKTADLGKMLF